MQKAIRSSGMSLQHPQPSASLKKTIQADHQDIKKQMAIAKGSASTMLQEWKQEMGIAANANGTRNHRR